MYDLVALCVEVKGHYKRTEAEASKMSFLFGLSAHGEGTGLSEGGDWRKKEGLEP